MTGSLLRTRPARVTPAVIVSLTLVLGAGLLGWMAVTAISDSGGSLGADLISAQPALGSVGALRWGSPLVGGTGAVLMALGLMLLVAAWTPGRRRIVHCRAEHSAHTERIEVALPTSAIADLAAAAADSVDGVSSVRASSNARSVLVTITSDLPETAAISADVEAAVSARLAEVGFSRTPTVKVRVQRRSA